MSWSWLQLFPQRKTLLAESALTSWPKLFPHRQTVPRLAKVDDTLMFSLKPLLPKDSPTWISWSPLHSEAITSNRGVRFEPEVQLVVGAVDVAAIRQLCATVFANHVRRGAGPIMNLQKVKVTLRVKLHGESGERNHQNLENITLWTIRTR